MSVNEGDRIRFADWWIMPEYCKMGFIPINGTFCYDS